MFGGSRVQIGGPTGAFVVIVAGIIASHGFEGLVIATFMAGILLIVMGLLKMGDLLKFIPHTLIAGFTTGIAVIIFSTQVKDFLGLRIDSVPADFVEKWISYGKNIGTLNFWALGIGCFTIGVMILFQKLKSKIPGSLVAILVSTAVVFFFKIPVETIYTRFGNIQASFPPPHLNIPDFSTLKGLVLPAVSIALLGAIESLLSAVVADGMIGSKHRSNIELIAQGGANIVSALFGGIPATGAIARTAANIKNGGRSPVAGIVHALTLLIILFVAAPLARLIPLSCLAGILMVVAWNMSEIKEFATIFKINIYEVMVLLTTFLLTVFFDLTIAIIAGFVLSVILFMKRISIRYAVSDIKVVDRRY